MFPLISYLQDTWRYDRRRMRSCWLIRINRVYRSPPDLYQRTWLMRSNDFICEIKRSRLIGYLINRGGDTWTYLDATMKIGRRKWQDREIVAHDHRAVVAHDHHAIMAVDRSSPDQTTLIFRAKFPYKYRFSSFVNLTHDWIVKKLSGFLAKYWVLRDPPTFRLDCNPIEAGLITNRCLIWSNSPLERRTYAEEEIEQYSSICVNWSQIFASIGLVV